VHSAAFMPIRKRRQMVRRLEMKCFAQSNKHPRGILNRSAQFANPRPV
jgi:hypothetical protein